VAGGKLWLRPKPYGRSPEPRPAGEAAANPSVVDDVINVTPAKTWKKPFRIDFATGHKDIVKLSKLTQQVRAKVWMPPETADTKKLNDHDFEPDWQTRYKAHYDALRRWRESAATVLSRRRRISHEATHARAK
jgi:hypothetical protein